MAYVVDELLALAIGYLSSFPSTYEIGLYALQCVTLVDELCVYTLEILVEKFGAAPQKEYDAQGDYHDCERYAPYDVDGAVVGARGFLLACFEF